ncbi:MAG TPA: DUF2892 domain-containing protein [Spirochaetia bacterium]|nr:DUF2892 domain-containing protein [Spirochaetia bacterium]
MSTLRNMGSVDRVIRAVIGVAAVVVAVTFQSWWGLLAALPLVTAAVGFCPLYALLRISTNRRVQHSAA